MGNHFGGTWRHHPLSDLTGHVLSSGSPCSLFCEMHAARLPVLVKGPLILDFLTAVSVEHTNRSTSGEVPVGLVLLQGSALTSFETKPPLDSISQEITLLSE